MNSLTDSTRDELLDWALDILKCPSVETKKAARWGLEQIVELVSTDCKRAGTLSRAEVSERLNEIATAADTALKCLSKRDVRRVLELQNPAIKLSRLHLRSLAKTALNASVDPDLHGGGNVTLEDVFDLPAKTKLAALVDPVFELFRGKRGATSANSDLDALLMHLWEIISGEEVDQSFEGHIRQARAKRGRKTGRRYAALMTAHLEAEDILDEIRKKLDR